MKILFDNKKRGCTGQVQLDNSSENQIVQDRSINNQVLLNNKINNNFKNNYYSYSRPCSASLIRIKKELIDFNKSPPDNFYITPKSETEIYDLNAGFIGPSNTPYEGGKFKLHILYPFDYPFRPPKCIFLTKIYHPNINSKGEIFMDILRDQWSPALTIEKILLSISSLLADPNFEYPLVYENEHMKRLSRNQYECTAREWTKKYAI